MTRRSGDSIRRIMPVNYSLGELAEIEDLIEAGELPKDYLEQHFDAVDANVFGEDAPKDRKGNRKEQGLGSSGNQTQQSIDAYIKNQTERRVGGPEPGFEQHLERMRKELAASEAHRAAQREKSAKTRKRRFSLDRA